MSAEQTLRALNRISGKFQRDIGIVIYGEVEGEEGTYQKILVKSDGTVKVEGTFTVSGDVDVSDRWARQLGQVDLARYLGSVMGVANPLHSQTVYGGAVIDPRSIRALTASDIVTVNNMISGFATETTLSALEGKDFATQTTLSAAKTDLDSLKSALNSVGTDSLKTVSA